MWVDFAQCHTSDQVGFKKFITLADKKHNKFVFTVESTECPDDFENLPGFFYLENGRRLKGDNVLLFKEE